MQITDIVGDKLLTRFEAKNALNKLLRMNGNKCYMSIAQVELTESLLWSILNLVYIKMHV